MLGNAGSPALALVAMTAPAAPPVISPVAGKPESFAVPANVPSVLPADNEPAIEETLRQLHQQGDVQFAFPGPDAPEPPPQWLQDLLAALEPLSRLLSPLFTGLFWLAVAALVAFLLYLIVPAFRDWVDNRIRPGKRKAEQSTLDNWQPDVAAARDLLAEADALAAQGRFADAVHLLLGRSIEDIERRRPGLLKPALTSRAIARVDALPPPARTAFSELAAVVERAIFALRPIHANDWTTARDAYGRFALRDQWAGRA